MTEPARRESRFDRLVGRLGLDGRTTVALLAALLALDVWAMASVDPDFYLPDPFRPFAVGLILLFVLTGFLPWPRGRLIVRRVALVVTVVVLLLEAHLRFRDDSSAGMVERTADVLLRYRYKPGASFGEIDANGYAREINHLGLMDVEHVIPKPADVFRVVVLSGSIANDGAIPFDERFWRKLEGELAGAPDKNRRVEVVNVSVHGYNEVQQVRLLEQVGLSYEPDLVVVGYMLTAATIQDGGYRRVGDSFFLFRFLPLVESAVSGSVCAMFLPFYERYSFDLIVRNSFERLALLQRLHGFRVLVAVLPVVEDFDDPTCVRIYDQVERTAREAGLPTVRVADAFLGERAARFAKPGGRWDVCHPNPDGHALIAHTIAVGVRSLLRTPAGYNRGE